ncbi:MAG: S9 family peptidase [Anaerolineae bacterium]|nr:S9 family peptidase [Anaerolineae bacterium]
MSRENLLWKIEKQIYYPSITEVAPSPDGRWVVYAVKEPLMTDERSEFLTHLYLASADGDEHFQLTFGEYSDRGAQWSPDGRYIAFLSTRNKEKANIYIMRVNGGEAWALTCYEKTNVAALKWSPDGKQIAFTMTEPPSEEKEKAQKAKNDPKLWGEDFDFQHLFVVPFVEGPRTPPEARQITSGRFHVVNFDWLPDSRTLAFTHRPTPVADDWPQTRLSLIAVDGDDAKPRELAVVADYEAKPVVSPDGHWIACGTSDRPARWAFANRIVLYPVDGGEPRPLAYTPDSQSGMIGWSEDGQEVYAWESSGVTSQIWALPITGESGRPITADERLKTLPAVNRRGQIAFVGQDFPEPNAVYLLDPKAGEVRSVAQPAMPEEWPDAPLPKVEVIRWKAPDGLEIEGILVYPLDYTPGQRYPLILEVHGGPAGVFSRSFIASPDRYANAAALAERGFAVLRPNPRGSSGYGKEFRFANHADWGGGDYADLMAGVDTLIEQGLVDPDRLGVLGWSYGGFMTSWIIGHTDRFKAACVGAGVTDLISMTGTSDIPGFLPDYFDHEFWEDLQPYLDHSPIFYVQNVSTPTLIQHGDADERVPISQGHELYNALKRRGVPVKMVIYPRQEHGFSEPRLSIDVKRRAVEWLERWILGQEEAHDRD